MNTDEHGFLRHELYEFSRITGSFIPKKFVLIRAIRVSVVLSVSSVSIRG